MKRAALLGVAFVAMALCGCATIVTWRQREGLEYFVGKSRQNLIGSLGTPTSTWSRNGSQYVDYDYNAKVLVPGEPGARDPNTGFRSRPWVDHRQCSTIFKLHDAHIVAWSLEGDACRDAPFPKVAAFSSSQMANAGATSLQTVTLVPRDPYTGWSAVNTGSFYHR